MPDLLITSRQRQVRYDHSRLQTLVHCALPMCIEVATQLGGPLCELTQVE